MKPKERIALEIIFKQELRKTQTKIEELLDLC